MHARSIALTLFLFFAGLAMAQEAAEKLPYTQEQDFVFAQVDGKDITMDIFKPTGEKNGLGIIDVASGAWSSSRGKIEDHKKAMFYDIFCKRGYVVFAIRPGSRGAYAVPEMVANLKRGIRYIKEHASDYGIDPERLGITGPSAGGHLATLTVLTADAGDPNVTDPLLRHSTQVAAAGIFFPPTDFLNWNGKPAHERLGDLYFKDGIAGKSPEQIEAAAKAASPLYQVKEKTIPFLIYHGDADPLVPLQQSQVLVDALKATGTEVEFHIVPGGAHPWPTIPVEVAKMGDWFDKRLGAKH